MPPKKNKNSAKSAIIHGNPKKKTDLTSLLNESLSSARTEKTATEKTIENDDSKDLFNEEQEAPASLQLIYRLQDFLNDNLTFTKFMQILIVAYTLNIMSLKYWEFLIENYQMIGFNLIGVLLASFISYFSNLRQFKKGLRSTLPKLPEFNLIYAVIFPICLSIIHKRSMIVLNLALNYAVLDFHWLAKIFVSLTFFQSYTIEDVFLPHQVAQLFVHYVVVEILKYLSWDRKGGRSLSKTEVQMAALLVSNLTWGLDENSQISLWIVQKLINTSIVLIVINVPVYFIYNSTNSKVLACLVLSEFQYLFYRGVDMQLFTILNESSVTWLRKFIFDNAQRTTILKIWIAELAVVIPLGFNFGGKFSLNTRRKFWHFSVFAILVQSVAIEYLFVQIALGGMITIFILVELLRATKFTFLGLWLNNLLAEFQDHRDKSGPLVLSYIFLISGIAFPILLNDKPVASSYVGLIALGVGDSFASIIGKAFGSIKWKGMNKTMEGTMAFVASTFICFASLKELGLVTDKSYEAIFITCLLGGLMEGVADMNDNFLLPCFMFVLMECF